MFAFGVEGSKGLIAPGQLQGGAAGHGEALASSDQREAVHKRHVMVKLASQLANSAITKNNSTFYSTDGFAVKRWGDPPPDPLQLGLHVSPLWMRSYVRVALRGWLFCATCRSTDYPGTSHFEFCVLSFLSVFCRFP